MNLYTFLLALLVVIVAVVLIIIRDAITVDGAKARAALGEFGSRIGGLFKRAK